MSNYLSAFFLREKIGELQTGLFFNHSSSVLKIPASVINILNADDLGQLWFCIPAHSQAVSEFDNEFLSELQLFKKGKPFYLKISGKTFIVTDPEEINNISWIENDLKQDTVSGRCMLIKVKMQYADYFETAEIKRKREWKNTFADFFYKIFEPYENECRPYRILQPDRAY